MTAADCGFEDGWDDSSFGERSVMVKAVDIKRADYTSVVSGEISYFDREAYIGALKARGAELLSKRRPVMEVSVQAEPSIDLRAGDIVSLRHAGIKGKRRAAVTELRRRDAGGTETVTVRLAVTG